ncbi:MAG: N-acetyltransferase, partial [Bacteroidetes bacterium]
MAVFYQSGTLSVELIAPSHAEPLQALVASQRAFLRPWLPWVDHMQHTDQFLGFIRGALDRYEAGTELPCMILYEGMLAGRVGLYQIDKANRSASVGYWLGESFQGKGLVTQATAALIRYGFRELGLNRIEIRCATGNHRSQAVPERLGFVREGILRESEWVQGQVHDLYVYALLEKEWGEGI